MTRILQSSWFISLTGTMLYLATTATLIRPGPFQEALAAKAAAEAAPSDAPSWKFRNPEFNQWVEEARREKEALDLRAQQLQELETRLAAERQELNTVTQTIAKLQSDFDRNVVRIKDQEVENLKRQAKVVAAMSPEGAAALVKQMSDDDVVRLLVTMKTEEASLLLDTLSKMGATEAKRAAAIAERMRSALVPASTGRAAQ